MRRRKAWTKGWHIFSNALGWFVTFVSLRSYHGWLGCGVLRCLCLCFVSVQNFLGLWALIALFVRLSNLISGPGAIELLGNTTY